MTDEELFLLYKEGDQDAFERLYRKFSPMVYGYLKKRLPSNDVEDAYQNVWRHLHEKRSFFSDQPFAPWFFHLIRNLLIDQYRSEGRRTKLNQEVIRNAENALPEEETDVEGIISGLSEDARDLVRKFYIEGYSYQDLEKESGVSQMNLRKRLSRAISQLRKKSGV